MPRLPSHMLLQAAFTVESVAHLRGLERELLPQAEYLRTLHAALKSWQAADGEAAQGRTDGELTELFDKGELT